MDKEFKKIVIKGLGLMFTLMQRQIKPNCNIHEQIVFSEYMGALTKYAEEQKVI